MPTWDILGWGSSGNPRAADPGSSASQASKPTFENYTRPRHHRIYCSHCDEAPEGYRGAHELRRHIERCHNPTRKVWICVEAPPASDGTPKSPLPKVPLEGCKRCRGGKQYMQYYNAAAHLRRAHFEPREKPKKAATNEKRGTKGSGYLLSVDVLKHWMKEIEVTNAVVAQETNETEVRMLERSTEFSDIIPPTDDGLVSSFEDSPPPG